MSNCKSGACGTCIDDLSAQFNVMPSFRDGLTFNASMIDPNAMDSELGNLEEDSSMADLPGTTPDATATKKHEWGWWSLVAPFIL